MKPWTLRCALLGLLLVVIGVPERPEAQVKTIAVGGTGLAYLDMGQGPPVVMVHGTTSDYRWWQAQMDEFSQRHRVIAYSLRHHHPNVSTGDRSDYLPRTHAADLPTDLPAHAQRTPVLPRTSRVHHHHQGVARRLPG